MRQWTNVPSPVAAVVTRTPPPPFHAEHVGSMLRPEALTVAFTQEKRGRIAGVEFTAAQDKAIREVVRLQESVGLQSITDGEFRRASYWSHFVEAVDGLTVRPASYQFRDAAGESRSFRAPHVVGKVRRSRSISGAEFDFLKSITTQTPKITLPSPPTMHFWGGLKAIEEGVYSDLDEFFDDLATVYRKEIADLARRGARYLQFDEVPLAMLCDVNVRATVEGYGEDPTRLTEKYIELINACLAERPPDVTIALHMCRGNFRGRWLSEGGYDQVAERLFTGLDVDAFFLEFDTPRAGDFKPLRHVPEDKSVVLGLVSTKSGALEDPDELISRIEEAARIVPLERLAISPQCGFSSTVGGNPLSLEDQENKLRLLVDVSRRVWE